MADTVLKVKAMSCQHCVMSITNALKGLKGVEDVYDDKLVILSQMKDAVTDAGYTAE